MTMIERVAVKLCQIVGGPPELFKAVAVEIVKTMREPTDDMTTYAARSPRGKTLARLMWKDMIDAALIENSDEA